MAGGGNVVIIGGNDRGERASVVNGRLLVSSIGGGASGDVNIAQVGGNVVAGATLPVDDGGGSLTVDGDLDVTVTEDDAVVASPDLLPVAAERDDGLSTLTPADGDWVHLRTDSRGALWARLANVYTALSGSTDGQPIQVTGTTSGTAVTLHTIPNAEKHRIYMTASNRANITNVTLTIEWGGTGAGNEMRFNLAPLDTIRIAVGEIISPTGGALTVTAYANAASAVNITGHIEEL